MRADIEAVVFDLDGTLLDRRRSFEQFVRDQWERFAHCLQTAGQERYVQTLIELDCDGYAPRKSLFTDLITRFKLPSGVAETLLDDYRAGFPNACVLFPDAVQTLSLLRTSGLKLGLITNGSIRMQSRKLQCLALSPLFDTVLISDAEGISKPDRQIFHRALERLNTHSRSGCLRRRSSRGRCGGSTGCGHASHLASRPTCVTSGGGRWRHRRTW